MKIENLEITEIAPYENSMWSGIKIRWCANVGFGECELFRTTGSDQWCADTESMSSNDDKTFLKMLLDKLADMVVVTG